MPLRTRRSTGLLLCGALLTLPLNSHADDPPGAALYRDQCARCHGAHGEGSEDHKKPLVGDRSVDQLTKFIAKTMPEDDPGSVSPEAAAQIAAYIHDAFYSPIAQARIKPARIELSRLTVRQFRNAAADLFTPFLGDEGTWDHARGLKAEYYKGRNFNKDNRVIERIDAQVNFDFGTNSPDPEKLEPREFSMRWQGGVLAPDTGDYEFIIHTDHAARLWVNNQRVPLIDAWVKSGNDTAYRATLPLLGGKVYALKLEFSKAKQGVDDSDKNKDKKQPPPKPAMIRLEWKPPYGTPQVIPARLLSPNRFSEKFVLATPFPPDDRSIGYERGTSVSKEWDQATTDAAIEVAEFVARRVNQLAGTRDDADDRPAKLRSFCETFAERAFRRPLTAEQKSFFTERQFKETEDPNVAVTRVVLLVLKSPRFCYEAASENPDDFDVASRLALALWDSLPDRALLDAAASGQLDTAAQVRAQADRLLKDLRARAKLRSYFMQWLKAEPPPELVKDPTSFPGFDAALFADLRTSLDLQIEDTVWSEQSDFRDLLTNEFVFLNGRLAAFFGADLPTDAPFQPIRLDDGARAGILTHPYVMSCLAYSDTTSPIHRGVFLTRGVLGRVLRPPPEAFAPLAPDLHPNLSTRERVDLQTSPEMCANCHTMINPLGYPLEQFDAVGRYRTKERDKPIDASGGYTTLAGETQKFSGARELAQFLINCDETHDAFIQQIFHHIAKQPVRAFGPNHLQALRDNFRANRYNIQALVAEIATQAALVKTHQPH